MSTSESKAEELERLRSRIAELESDVDAEPTRPWQATEYYATYYATAGFFLGMIGALVSLSCNVVGSLFFDQYPLKIIQVYLTFPLGEAALTMDRGVALAIGCCLYIATGMLFGIPFQMVLARFTPGSPWMQRVLLASAMGIGLWILNYYAILSWLQPLLFGGNWIVETVPWYVGLLTHLSYGMTMALVYPLGVYEPYKLQTDR